MNINHSSLRTAQHRVHIRPENSRDRKQDSALARFDAVNKEIADLSSAFTAQDNKAADEAPAKGEVTLNSFESSPGTSLTGTLSQDGTQISRETKTADGSDTFQFWTSNSGQTLHVNQDVRSDSGSSFISEKYEMDAQGNLVVFNRNEVER